jgi:hypothetical protein
VAETREQWLRRVLGVAIPPPGRAAAPAAKKLLPIWQSAKGEVDDQLNALAAVFRRSGHPVAEAIADQGLPMLTGRAFVGLTAALFDYDGAGDDKRDAAAGQVRDKLQAFRAMLANDGLWAVLERNPLGVSVSLRPVIQQSLDDIQAALG